MEAFFYEGDLLVAVLRAPVQYWEDHPDERQRADRVIASFESLDPGGNDSDVTLDNELVRQAVDGFRTGSHASP